MSRKLSMIIGSSFQVMDFQFGDIKNKFAASHLVAIYHYFPRSDRDNAMVLAGGLIASRIYFALRGVDLKGLTYRLAHFLGIRGFYCFLVVATRRKYQSGGQK